MSSQPVRAIVLSGGGARGAYEAGVLAYIFQQLPEKLFEKKPIRLVCGTSVGAIHACFLAATAHLPQHHIVRMLDLWRGLRIDTLLRLRTFDVLRMPFDIRALFQKRDDVQGVIINATELQRVIMRDIPWTHIRHNLNKGLLDALTVSATHVASGKTTVFIDRPRGGVPPWTRDERRVARGVRIGPMHALASAAIPILFPAINLDGVYYCDGGLRQNTPLSPALRLGADRVLVISLSSGKGGDVPPDDAEGVQEPYPGPFLLMGKVLNALMLDHLDYDLGRLHGFNQLLRDGTAAFGPQFVEHLSQTTERVRGASYREVIPTVIRPSRDLGEIANEWVEMGASGLSGLAGFILRQIAHSDRANHSDLLSYLCFDGRLAASLIQLGMEDADAMRERLIAFFSE